MLRIFIGFDNRFKEPAHVLAYSIRKHASIPVHIQYLEINNLENVYGFKRDHDPLASTEFTYSRFLVPYLCGYEGNALFLDNDMICIGDVKDLYETPMESYALRVVKHNYAPATSIKMYGAVQTTYPRKNWSSAMLMNCSKLKSWTKSAVERQSGAWLHQFKEIPDELIGDLNASWNRLNYIEEPTNILHYTEGGPWYEKYYNCPHADLWRSYRDEMYKSVMLN